MGNCVETLTTRPLCSLEHTTPFHVHTGLSVPHVGGVGTTSLDKATNASVSFSLTPTAKAVAPSTPVANPEIEDSAVQIPSESVATVQFTIDQQK
mmetsp:Transcript_16135/g.50035  ORF Transcript_16135/g.50035 Transcript_16135/m.50035 type:complete len:95 (-) Transcript_16135:264-548(-)